MSRGAFTRALGYARLGERLAPARTAPSVWLPQREAQVLTRLGDPAALDALARADRRHPAVPVVQGMGWWGYTGADLHGRVAFVHARLGKAARAVEHATEALRQLRHSPLHQACTRVDLGLARLAQGEVDAAAGEAAAALARYQQRPSALGDRWLSELDAALQARHPRAAAVREFHEAYQATRAQGPTWSTTTA